MTAMTTHSTVRSDGETAEVVPRAPGDVLMENKRGPTSAEQTSSIEVSAKVVPGARI